MTEKPLNQELFDDPERFEFFQAVRILERMFPERASVGRDGLPSKEIVRFRSRASLAFPQSQIHEIIEVNDEFSEQTKNEMLVNFMGMIGPMGVLPNHYTELVITRARFGRDTSLWAFLDLFTHRAISLFFRAWEKYRFPVQYERGNDHFTKFLLDFAGIGTRGLRGKLNLPDESLLPYGGLIAQKPHSAISIEKMLADYFDVKCEIQQFSGQWLALDDESITKVGTENSHLGLSVVIGTRIWDNQSKFRVVFGPLPFIRYQAFLPNGSAHKAATSMIRFMVGEESDFDLQLKLKAKEVPGCILTTRAKRRPMLGWTSFLKTKPFKKDDDQLVLQTGN